VKPFRWGPEKNAELLAERGIAFEQVEPTGGRLPKAPASWGGTTREERLAAMRLMLAGADGKRSS
jgi:hypothetical protein